jgi:hypothetical protein
MAVEGDPGGFVPVLDLMFDIELSLLGAHGCSLAVTTRGFILEHEQEQVLMRHLLLTCEGEALWECVEDARQLEASQDGA